MDTVPDGAVVVGVDGSDRALEAVRWGAVEAERRGAPLHLVGAVEWTSFTPIGAAPLGQEYEREAMTRHTGELLEAAAGVAREAAPGIRVGHEVRGGNPAAVLVACAEEAALLVLGNRGRGGFAGLLLGSVGVSVAARASCPVVIVRGGGDVPAGAPVVVGVEGGHDEPALGFAFEEAALRRVPLVAVHAWSEAAIDPFLVAYVDWEAVEKGAHELLRDALAPWTGKFPDLEVRSRVVRDNAALALVQQAEGAALVVVGSRGRGGIRGALLGSVSQAVLHHAQCPTVVVRAGGDA